MRKIECPYCTGEVLSEQNGRTTSSASLFPRLQNFLNAFSDLLALVTGNTKTVSRKEAIGGDCKVCKNTGFIEDPTDITEIQKARADFYIGKEEEIEKESGALGESPGGSRITRIAGADVLIVGHELNTAKSYTVKENVAGFGNMVTKANGRGAVEAGNKEHTAVIGNNVPANSGGGQYIIQCGNRFQLLAGSQGISLKTTGPIEIDGGIVSFTGADMTFGTRVGQTAIAGNDIVMEAKNIKMTPTGAAGQVVVAGSMAASGNVHAPGLYSDNAYFSRVTMPKKQVSTKAGSTTRYVGGPPTWGGLKTSALKNALIDMQKLVIERTTDLDLFKAGGPLSPRFQFNIADATYNITYTALPIEPYPTGICVIVDGTTTAIGGVGLIWNFPHVHMSTDEPHTHVTDVPAINYEQHETAESVRQAFDSAGGNTPIAATGGSSDVLGTIGGFFGSLGQGLQALGDSIAGFFGRD